MGGGGCVTDAGEEERRFADIVLAVAFLALAAIQIAKALELAKKSLENLCDIQERQLAMSNKLKDIWLNVQHAQKMKALCDALEMEIPSMDKNSAYSKFRSMSNIISNQAKQAQNIWMQQYGICKPMPCDRSIDIAAINANTNAGHAVFKYQQRRTERRRELKYRVVQSAHASSMVEPAPMLDLLNTAATISWSKLQLGLSNLSGAAGLAGVGAGLLNFGNDSQAGATQGTSNFTSVTPGSSSGISGGGLSGGGGFG